MSQEKPILVVGAGFAGAVYARTLAEEGYRVIVIDRRDHIGGNAFDFVDENGVRVHRYGPHLFHTNNERVVRWLQRFGTWIPYEHRVEAVLADGRFVPLPINRNTINAVFNVSLGASADVERFLTSLAVANDAPANAAEYLMAHIGRELTDIFFRPYTRKMWALDLEDLSAAVVKRIPIRHDDEARYFPGDTFQMLPQDGYTAIFERIFDHRNIELSLGETFGNRNLDAYEHCFSSAPIDEYFDYVFGPLPYRSIRFHHRPVEARVDDRAATLNFTDASAFTRETDWSKLPAHRVAGGSRTTITREEPCDYRDNDMERYYPIKTSDGRYDAAYRKYQKLAEDDSRLSFIGRCGTYQYLDMHQVINQSLAAVTAWIGSRAPA